MTRSHRIVVIRARAKLRKLTSRCSDTCPGWAVFQATEGFEIQACDECWSAVEGSTHLFDNEAAHLPEAIEALTKTVGAYVAEWDKSAGLSVRPFYGLYECVDEISPWMRSLNIPGVPGLSGEERDDLDDELARAKSYTDQHHPAGVH